MDVSNPNPVTGIMAKLSTPSTGLELLDDTAVDGTSDSAGFKIIQLDLSRSVFNNLMKEAHEGRIKSSVTFGKLTTINGRDKSSSIMSSLADQKKQKAVYRRAEQAPASRYSYFGHLSESMDKARQARAAATKKKHIDDLDDAELALQQSMAILDRQKQENTTIFVKDANTLPTTASSKRTPKTKPSSSIIRSHQRTQEVNKGVNPLTATVVANAPATGIHSTWDERKERADCIKKVLLYRLSYHPSRKDQLIDWSKCEAEDIESFLNKYGLKQTETGLWELTPRAYKEVDLYAPDAYRTSADFETARNRAIKAYDRQRIGPEGRQKLLHPSERGKVEPPTFLGKLNTDPHKPWNTPSIHVENADKAKSKSGSSDESEASRGRPGQSDTITVSRPTTLAPESGTVNKKRKMTEREAQAKRLFANKKPKLQASSTPSSTPKTQPTKVTSAAKKSTTVVSSSLQPKSSEFIENSDEEADMQGLIAESKPKASISPPVKGDDNTTSKGLDRRKATSKVTKTHAGHEKNKGTTKAQVETLQGSGKSPLLKAPTSPSNKANSIKSVRPSGSTMRRTFSHQRNTSSPIKPSPLASSPPTNASELHHDFKTFRSTPTRPSPTHSPYGERTPLLQKAPAKTIDAHAISKQIDMKAGRPTSAKRKADELDEGNNDAKSAASAITVNGSKAPSANGVSRNDVAAPTERPYDPVSVKRQRTSPKAPSIGEDSENTSTSPSESGDLVTRKRQDLIKQSADFKVYWDKYKALHTHLTMTEQSEWELKDTQRLAAMHTRVEEMKKDLWQMRDNLGLIR
ncbi:hypothetical protein MMC25_003271 [Agyrium rufum]|nr:hypothetical protein [Agyrium rufum]